MPTPSPRTRPRPHHGHVHRPGRHALAPMLVLALAAAGCGHGRARNQAQAVPATSSTTTTTSAATTTTKAATKTSGHAATKPKPQAAGPARVIVVVEENHSYSQIIGNPSAPFINQLAGHGTLLTGYFAVSHPSLPNYLAMTSGDTQGITSDCPTCTVPADNLGAQLNHAGIRWKAYAQSLPGPCSNTPNAGDYARKHEPFMYYDTVRNDGSCGARVVPTSQLDADVAAGTLPSFAFVTPDILHDMHGNGGQSDAQRVAAGDAWLRDLSTRLVASPAWRQDTRLVVTFDEGEGAEGAAGCCGGVANGGHVLTIVTGPRVPSGQDSRPYSHYALLRSIEARFGLPYLRHAGDPASTTIPAIAG
ncbi:MAG TPA: alkaline phosphatase family protein [Actinomycetota bacterium]